ncbi:MAG TPA: hypothetical protein VIH35_06190, partial [Kiritimatiellia bacterium]
VLVGGYALIGDKVSAFILNGLAGNPVASVVEWLFQYLPLFSKLDLITRYTDGIRALAAWEFAGLVAYGALFTLFGLVVAITRFRRMAL